MNNIFQRFPPNLGTWILTYHDQGPREPLTLIAGAPAELGDLVLHGDVAPEYVELPEYELPLGLFDTKPAMDWLTPAANVNCSRSSTFVLPLAVKKFKQN